MGFFFVFSAFGLQVFEFRAWALGAQGFSILSQPAGALDRQENQLESRWKIKRKLGSMVMCIDMLHIYIYMYTGLTGLCMYTGFTGFRGTCWFSVNNGGTEMKLIPRLWHVCSFFGVPCRQV